MGSAARAGVPQQLAEQGHLVDSSGNPVAGSVQIVFAIYTAASGGTMLWTETQTVTLDGGYFSAALGEVTPIPASVFAGGATLYLGVTIGSDAEMSPRQTILSVPYAMVAGNVNGDITPTSVSVDGGVVINSAGEWVGPTSGARGAAGSERCAGRHWSHGRAGGHWSDGSAGQRGCDRADGSAGQRGCDRADGSAGQRGRDRADGSTGRAWRSG
jgi:hypothetical protein